MPRGQEQRLQLRFPVTEEEGVTGLLNGEGSREIVGIHDLSLTGAGLVVADINSVRGSRLLQLGAPHTVLGETRIEPVHLKQLGPSHQLVGVRFQDHGTSFLKNLCRFLVHHHSQSTDTLTFLSDPTFVERDAPQQVRRLLIHCCRRKRQLQVYNQNGVPCGVFLPEVLRRERVVGALVLSDGRSPGPKDAFRLVLSSFTALYVFAVQLVGMEDERVSFTVEGRYLEGGGRRGGRLRPPNDAPVCLDFLHPHVSGRMVHKEALEVGLGGLCFALDVDEDLLVPGSILDSAVLRLPGGRSIACRCVVRHTSRHGDRYTCGVRFEEFSGNGRQHWVQAIIARLNPNVDEATPFNLDQVWDVFERSGYLEEKPGGLDQMRQPFLDTWSQLLGSEGSRCWVYRDEQHSVGTICASRIYSTTWLIHHMAVNREVGASRKLSILADLGPKTALQWISGVAPEDHILIYYNAHNTFNERPYHQFFRTQDPLGVSVSSIRLWDVPVAEAAGRWHAGNRVRQASPAELEVIAADLNHREGPLVSRAFGYAAETLRFGGGVNDFHREREVVVVGQHGSLEGYALLEVGPAGHNIFSLYDACRMVVLGQHSSEVRDVLFAAAVEFYGRHGTQSFLVLAGEGDSGPPPQWEHPIELVRSVVTGHMVPAWAAHLVQLWSLH